METQRASQTKYTEIRREETIRHKEETKKQTDKENSQETGLERHRGREREN